ncbi:MAG TPA: hypothetical protein VEO54_15860 [Thermoanaerobaculia bacterium]|nr:hypothetical protein [Thermoanaerobaculia bacterium]
MRRLQMLFCMLLLATPVRAFQETPASELTFAEAAGFQRWPDLATDNDTHFFAVWTDDREGAPVIYGARVNGTRHQVTDLVGVRLFESGGRAAVAYGGLRFLVVDSLLQYAVVDRDARVLARGRIPGQPAGKPSIVYNGREFLVFHGRDEVRVATVDTDGRLLAEPVTLVPANGVETQIHDASTYFQRQRIVLLYSRGGELFGLATSRTGAPLETVSLGGGILTTTGGPAKATIAAVNSSSPTGFLVAWHRDAANDVMVLRLDVNGLPLGSAQRVAGPAGAPELAENNGELLLFTIEGEAVVSRRIGILNGIGVGVPSIEIGNDAVAVAAAYGPGGVLAVVNVEEPFSNALRIAGDFSTVTLSVTGREQPRPAIASGRDGQMVVWASRREEDPPSIAVVGGTYLAVYGSGKVWFQLYRGGGPVGLPVTLDADGRWPVVAAVAGDFIVAWTHFSEVRFARVSTAGVVMATGTVPSTPPSAPVAGLACDAGECILAWHEATIRRTCPLFSCTVIDEQVKAIRFDDDLVIRDTLVLTPEATTQRERRGRVVAAAHDGEYAVAWEERLDIRAVTVDRTGAVESSTRVAGTSPAVARQKDSWLLVREVGDQLVARWLPGNYERALTPNDGQARRAPSLFSLGDRVLMVYERTTRNEAAGGVPRAYVTTVDLPPPRRRAASFR